MKALDTNALVRFLVRDDARQGAAVRRLLKKAEETREPLFVPQLVVLELIWVLESAYDVARDELLDAVDALLHMPALRFENRDAVRTFVRSARAGKTDLADLLIAAAAHHAGCDTVLTFDKKAARGEGFEGIR